MMNSPTESHTMSVDRLRIPLPRTMDTVCLFGILFLGIAAQVRAEDLVVRRLPVAVQEQTRMLNADYLAAVPVVEKQGTKLPLLVFLHGAGGRGRRESCLSLAPSPIRLYHNQLS